MLERAIVKGRSVRLSHS